MLPKKIRDLQAITRVQVQTIERMTKELSEMNRCQRETYQMLMEEAATKLQRRKRTIDQTWNTEMDKGNSISIKADIMTIAKRHRVSQENSPEVMTTYGGLREVPTLATDTIDSLFEKRDETNMPIGCQMCGDIQTGMIDANPSGHTLS
jgi:hypothetical protein